MVSKYPSESAEIEIFSILTFCFSFDSLLNLKPLPSDFRRHYDQSRVELLHRAFGDHLQAVEILLGHLRVAKPHLRAGFDIPNTRISKIYVLTRR